MERAVCIGIADRSTLSISNEYTHSKHCIEECARCAWCCQKLRLQQECPEHQFNNLIALVADNIAFYRSGDCLHCSSAPSHSRSSGHHGSNCGRADCLRLPCSAEGQGLHILGSRAHIKWALPRRSVSEVSCHSVFAAVEHVQWYSLVAASYLQLWLSQSHLRTQNLLLCTPLCLLHIQAELSWRVLQSPISTLSPSACLQRILAKNKTAKCTFLQVYLRCWHGAVSKSSCLWAQLEKLYTRCLGQSFSQASLFLTPPTSSRTMTWIRSVSRHFKTLSLHRNKNFQLGCCL